MENTQEKTTINKPLKGVVIAEAIHPSAPEALHLTASMCGKLAQDLGAKVVRIITADSKPFESNLDIFLNTHKQLITVEADHFVEHLDRLSNNFDSQITDTKTFEALSGKGNKALTVVVGMAIDDPLGGNEFTLAARSGQLDMVGDPNRQPLKIGGHQIPYAAGLACYLAMVNLVADQQSAQPALSHRVDLLDIAIWLNWKSIGAASLGLPIPTRLGNDGIWLVVPCKDGYLALVYRSSDWKKLTSVLGDERLLAPEFASDKLRRENQSTLNAIFNESFMHLTRAEIRQIALENKLPLGPVSSMGELIDDKHMQSRAFFQSIETENVKGLIPTLPVKWNKQTFSADTSTEPLPNRRESINSKPFSNCRVLDLGIITAGAATSAILADLGADVIKIEGPINPDPFRYWDGPVVEGDDPTIPPYFRMTNRGKRNLVLDLKSPVARDVFLEMVKTSDVIVENFRRGVLDSWGLSFDDLKAANPNIILASISSQGETGPDSKYVSFGNTLEAMAGLASITGYTGGPPVVTGADFNYPDQVVAIFAASMIETAWLAKEQNGGAVHLDLSQRELTTFMCGEAVLKKQTERTGNAQDGTHLQDCFKSADGDWIALSITENDIAKLQQEGCDDGYQNVQNWIKNRDTTSVLDILNKHGIANAKVLSAPAVLEQHSKSWSRAIAKGANGLLVKGVLFDSTDRPASVDIPADRVGALSAEILSEHSGLSGAELDHLLESVGAKAVMK